MRIDLYKITKNNLIFKVYVIIVNDMFDDFFHELYKI
jgi:hypothetical protein